MDENYLLAATRYVERNPLVAGLAPSPEDYLWSSACYHSGLSDDPLIQGSPIREMVVEWKSFLQLESEVDCCKAIQQAERTGRPLGVENFDLRVGGLIGRSLERKKPGPKPKGN